MERKTILMAFALIVAIGGSAILYNSLRGEAPVTQLMDMRQAPSGQLTAKTDSPGTEAAQPDNKTENPVQGTTQPDNKTENPATEAAQQNVEAESPTPEAAQPDIKTENTATEAAQQNTEAETPTPEAAQPTAEAEIPAAENQAEERIKAPDFTVQDAQGNDVKLSDMLGKPIVLNFWASWCPPCRQEMPEFNAVYEELGGEVQFMMVDAVGSRGETKEDGEKYITGEGFTFPVFYDMNQDATTQYSIRAFPTSIFIDNEGYYVVGAEGAIDESTLRLGIEMAIEQSQENAKR